MTFDSASFLGAPIETTVLVFDGSGETVHPFAVDSLGDRSSSRASRVVNVVRNCPMDRSRPATRRSHQCGAGFLASGGLGRCAGHHRNRRFCSCEDPLTTPATMPRSAALRRLREASMRTFSRSRSSNNVPEAARCSGPSYPYEYSLQVNVADGLDPDRFHVVGQHCRPRSSILAALRSPALLVRSFPNHRSTRLPPRPTMKS